MSKIPVITIDGPSGSGKGTISRKLADKLGWNFLDSGAIYRVFALAALQHGIPLSDITALLKLAANLEVKFLHASDGSQQIIYGKHDISQAIRQEGCGIFASKLAEIAQVRVALLTLQQGFLKSPGLVADGRDMGTVVFPDARLKFFLTASPEERAKRRKRQLQERGINVSLDEVLSDLLARDARDEHRLVAPLKPANDAIVIDTTKLSIDDVLQLVLKSVFANCEDIIN